MNNFNSDVIEKDDRNDERLKGGGGEEGEKRKGKEGGGRKKERRGKRIGGMVECLYTAHLYEILSRHADLKCLLRR